MKIASPQARKAYLLLKDHELTAKELAAKLGIVPNSIYRLLKTLTATGLVEAVVGYPKRYRALPAQTAVSYYLSKAMSDLRNQLELEPGAGKFRGPDIAFITDRKSLLDRTARDAGQASNSIDMIVSGHELPAPVYASYQSAIQRGVHIRRLVHQPIRRKTLENRVWKRIGTEVRYRSGFEFRLIIFDQRLVYITSFDDEHRDSALGVRFDYEPVAALMQEVFEQAWTSATEI